MNEKFTLIKTTEDAEMTHTVEISFTYDQIELIYDALRAFSKLPDDSADLVHSIIQDINSIL